MNMEDEPAHSKPGRRGDPRMNRAVAARLENAELSLFDALRAGGFDWSVQNGPKDKIFDSEGVSLSQRKNQLNRRLRQHKKKAALGESMPQQEMQYKHSSVEMFSFTGMGNPVDTGNIQQDTELAQPSHAFLSASTQEHTRENLQQSFSPFDDENKSIPGKGTKRSMETFAVSRPAQARRYDEDTLRTEPTHMPFLPFQANQTEHLISSTASTRNTNAADILHSNEEREKEDIMMGLQASLIPSVSATKEDERKMEKAVDSFHIKNSILLKKCLLMAQFPPDQIMEGSDTFHEFAKRATNEVLDTAWLNMMYLKGSTNNDPSAESNKS